MSTPNTHSPLNLYSKLDKDNLKFDPKKIILSELPCVASPRNKAVKISLFDVLKGIENPAKVQLFESHRKLEKSKRDAAKEKNFKAYTFSIDYAGDLTGLLVIDIDHIKEKTGKAPQELKEEIQDFLPFLFLAISNSGEGLFGIVRYLKENDLKAVGMAIYDELDLMFDIQIDKLFDAPRLRIDSYDPKPFKNYDAAIYDGILIEATPAKVQSKNKDAFNIVEFSNNPAVAFNNSPDCLEIIIPLAESNGFTVTIGKGKEKAIFDRPNGKPRSVVAMDNEGIMKFAIKSDTLKEQYKKAALNPYEFARELLGFKDDKPGNESMLKYLVDKGFGEWSEPQIIKSNSKESYSSTIDFLELKNLKLNQLTGVVEIAGSPINDTHTAQLITELSLLTGKNQSKEILQTCIDVVSNRYQYHPFMEIVEELKQLPATDFTQASELDKLNECFTSSTPKDLRLIYLSRWMLGLFDLHVRQRMTKIVLILAGSQNAGKTSFAKNILPEASQQYGKVVEFNQNKMVDAKVNLCSILVACFDEFEAILERSKTLSDFKNLTSSYDILERRPFRRNPEQMFRSSIIMATTNEKSILNDPTGNTRFLTIDVQSFDFKKYNSLDMHKVWRVIYDLYKAGESSVLSDSERTLQAKENINFESEDFVIGLIENIYRIDEAGFITSTDILVELEKNTKQNISIKRIGQALRKMGIDRVAKKVKGKVLRGYNLKYVYED